MNDYNLAQYYDETFGIDAAEDVVRDELLLRLDELDSTIDIELEESYH